MIRHVVMFRWKPEMTDDDVAAIEDGLSKLPGEIPEIQRYTFGPDAGINEGNFQFVVVADFDSVDDYVAYRDNPVHRAFIDEHIRPNVADRAAVQFTVN